MFEKFLSPPNHSVSVCVKEKIINRKVGYGLEISAEYIYISFMVVRKLFNGQREH